MDGLVTTFRELCDELRCQDTEQVRAGREEAIREQRKWRTRELAHTLVLDERDALAKDQAARDGETESKSQRKRRTAKKLEHRPNLGNAAMNGELSEDQLDPATDLVDDDEDDEEITETAKHTSPHDLQRMARDRRREQSRQDSVKRRNRRSLRKWRDDDGFLCGRFEIPMEHGGAIVESFFDQVVDKMRPATGEAWEPLDRRQADVLITLCQMEAGADDNASEATVGARVDVHVDISLDGEATLGGVTLPEEWVDAARANARIHLRVVDDDGNVIAEDRARTFVSQKADARSSAETGDVDGRVATGGSDSRSIISNPAHGAEVTTRRISRRCVRITTGS